MEFVLAEKDRSWEPGERIEITVEELLSRQYVHFCPTDAWKPNINIYETEDAVVICADLAGMRPDDIRVEVERNHLMLRGARQRPIPECRGGTIGVHLMEIDTGDFCRELEVPQSVDRERITARYSDGLLWITLPKIG